MLIKSLKLTELCFGMDVYCFDQFDLKKERPDMEIGHQRKNSFGGRTPTKYWDDCSLY